MITATQPMALRRINKMATTPIKPEQNIISTDYEENDKFMVIYAEDGTPMTPGQITAMLQPALDAVDRGEGRPLEEFMEDSGIEPKNRKKFRDFFGLEGNGAL